MIVHDLDVVEVTGEVRYVLRGGYREWRITDCSGEYHVFPNGDPQGLEKGEEIGHIIRRDRVALNPPATRILPTAIVMLALSARNQKRKKQDAR